MIGELIPQPFKQIIDRKFDHFGVDGTGLDLVDVEHVFNVPDIAPESRRALPQGSRPSSHRQSSPAVPAPRQASAAAGAGHDLPRQEIAISRHWQHRPAAGFAEFVGCPPPLGDVGECDDNTFHRTALDGMAICADVPGAAPRFDLALDRLEALQHRLRVGSRAPSAASDVRSPSGRPTSLGMTPNSDFVAGMKSGYHWNRGSRRNTVLSRTFCRIIESGPLPLQRFPELAVDAASSSFSDCNSSFDVRSSRSSIDILH